MKKKTKPGTRISSRWQQADRKFAIATIALTIFLFLAGFTSWLLGQNPSIAVAGSPAASSKSSALR
jgi:hypothetical protein